MCSYPFDLISVVVLIADFFAERLELSLRPFEFVIPMPKFTLFDVKEGIELLIRCAYKAIFWSQK